MKRNLTKRLAEDGIVCAEGYLFEMERRGYLTAGEFVPEVALENPEALKTLHRDFQHAGSDVIEAFTYNAHREKMRIIGKEDLLEPLNRAALKIAKDFARKPVGSVAGIKRLLSRCLKELEDCLECENQVLLQTVSRSDFRKKLREYTEGYH